jgi:hypothetical protein
LFFHLRKTVKLAQAVLEDSRVHWVPKVAFVTGVGTLLLALIFPELITDLVALGVPGVGWAFDALGLPTEFAMDWVFVSVAAFNLLKLFPAEIVGEHYDRLFRSRRGNRAA